MSNLSLQMDINMVLTNTKYLKCDENPKLSGRNINPIFFFIFFFFFLLIFFYYLIIITFIF